MKKVVLLFLVILAVSFAVNTDLIRVKTIQPDNDKPNIQTQPKTNAILPANNGNPYPLLPDVGRTEIIGGTCYDWINGPVFSTLVNDPANGIHATWMWSNTEAMADRNMYYNYYDWTTKTWNWINTTNYMNSGLAVFPHTLSSVGGGADLDPITGNFVISGMYTIGGVLSVKLARDQSPGAGLFEYSQGPTGYRWPCIGVTNNQNVQVAAIDAATTYLLYYARTTTPWTTWTPYVNIAPPAPDPYFPDQNIAASKISNKVIIVWEESEPIGPRQDRGYYQLSTNGGVSWEASTQIPFPPAFSGIPEIAPSFHISSFFAMFDAQDNFHIVASVGDTSNHILPCEIWHYCPTNNPVWSFIHRYDPDTFEASGGVGYNAIGATRPSICRNPTNNYLYVAWEQFDSLNYEPLTSQARADIHIAESRDNGLTWIAKTKITSPNTMSKRFPIVGGVQGDTLLVMYMADSIAGFFLQGEHRFCVNPIILHRVRVPLTPGIEYNNSPKHYNFTLLPAIPNPTRTQTAIRYSLPTTGNVTLSIHDVSGRLVSNLISETKSAGEYSVVWNGRNESGKKVNAGIYFYTLKTDAKSFTQKLIITN
jgi:hypothetical protein